jgi:REP element-mobilizing transposase RayT
MGYDHFPQFFTATILEWKHLLRSDANKKIITDSLSFLVQQKRVVVYSFVIMPNHLHLIWHISSTVKRADMQRDFLKYTAYQLIKRMKEHNDPALHQHTVNAADRRIQIWERNPLSVNIYTEKMFFQKMHYIHRNPIADKWKLCNYPPHYRFSSASFYEFGKSEWSFLTHFM